MPISITEPTPGVSTNWGDTLNTALNTIVNAVNGPPNLHAPTHATGGTDPLTPAAIGAATNGQSIAFAIALGG